MTENPMSESNFDDTEAGFCMVQLLIQYNFLNLTDCPVYLWLWPC